MLIKIIMKLLLPKLLIIFFVGIIYLLGHIYQYIVLQYLVVKFPNHIGNLYIIILLVVFIVIPLFAAIRLKKRGEYIKSLFFAGFANILSFQGLIQSIWFLTSPTICNEPDYTLDFIIRHALLFIVSMVSIGIFSNIVKAYRLWILLSYLLLFLFNMLVVQGWIYIFFYDEQIRNSLYSGIIILLYNKPAIS